MLFLFSFHISKNEPAELYFCGIFTISICQWVMKNVNFTVWNARNCGVYETHSTNDQTSSNEGHGGHIIELQEYL